MTHSAKPSLLATFWFGLQMVWGAILAVSLQARTSEISPQHSIEAYALIAAFGALAGAAIQVAIGPLSDRYRVRSGNRRVFYAVGAFFAAAALFGFYAAHSVAELVVAFLLLQLGMNVATGPYQAIIPDYVPIERAGLASSWMSAFQFLGNSAGLIAAGFIANTMLLATVLAAALAISSAVSYVHAGRVQSLPVYRIRIRFDSAFRTLLFSRGLINIGFYTLLGFLFYYVRDSLQIHDVGTQTALLFLTFTLFGIAGAVVAARPADRWDKRIVVTCANAAIAGTLLVLASAHNEPVAFVAAALAGAAWGAFFTADWALACGILPKEAMASAMGVWNLGTALPQIVAPLIAWPLVDALNRRAGGLGPRASILLALLEFTLGTAWLWRIPRERAINLDRKVLDLEGSPL